MASVVTYGNGLRRIDFLTEPNGPRRSIRLGRVTKRSAERIMAHVEALIADRMTGAPHSDETSRWLAGLDERMLARLRTLGLAEGVGLARTTLGAFLERVETASAVKESTAVFYGHTRRNLRDYFGEDRAMATIDEAEADSFRAWLVGDQGLATATVARRIVACRTIWRQAIRWRMARSNPFERVATGSQQNAKRQRFISVEIIHRVLDECPDAEWRLLVGLARFGGLRTPSEPLALRWDDVDFHRGTIRVRSSKTEQHRGGGVRIVPLFAELRPLLLDAFEQAPEGAEYVIGRCRDSAVNLRTQLRRIIGRAGVEDWPRLWQNLRASRETELLRSYDLATVCRWIGNTPAVAAQHYAMSADLGADFRRAVEGDAGEAQQKAQQTAPDRSGQVGTDSPGESRKPLRDAGLDTGCPSLSSPDKTPEWAWEDSNLRPHRYHGLDNRTWG